jgi:outer membrane lipase/esterase
MKMKKLCQSLLLGFILCATPLRAQNHPFTEMVVFGDSLSDGGNLIPVISLAGEDIANYLTGYDPNFYFNHRFSNGPIWVDQLHASLGFGSFGTLERNDGGGNREGTNFAWAGSRSGAGYYETFFPNLQPQIGFYSNQLAEGNPPLPAPATTLFTIWSGANDVFAHVEKNDPVTPTQVAENISLAIGTLYNEGGRYFLVPNLPPIGLIPSYVDDPIKGPIATTFVNASNILLDAELDALSASLEGITIFKVDIHSLFLDITANYEDYGFTNVTDTAYYRYEPYELRIAPYGELTPNSDGYFYWDAAHGTTLANSYIAQAAYHSIVPEPSAGLLLLLSGLCLLGCARRPQHRPFSVEPNP